MNALFMTTLEVDHWTEQGADIRTVLRSDEGYARSVWEGLAVGLYVPECSCRRSEANDFSTDCRDCLPASAGRLERGHQLRTWTPYRRVRILSAMGRFLVSDLQSKEDISYFAST